MALHTQQTIKEHTTARIDTKIPIKVPLDNWPPPSAAGASVGETAGVVAAEAAGSALGAAPAPVAAGAAGAAPAPDAAVAAATGAAAAGTAAAGAAFAPAPASKSLVGPVA